MMLKLQMQPSTNRFVKIEISRFVRWVENNYHFPLQLHLNITGANQVRTRYSNGIFVASSFFPYDEEQPIEINIATGDFFSLVASDGKDDAVYITMLSIAQQLAYYFQVVKEKELNRQESLAEALRITEKYEEFRGYLYEK
ncbi:hypothetical protein [Enterococcus sp. LJL120]